MNKTDIIYVIKNTITDKSYIGQKVQESKNIIQVYNIHGSNIMTSDLYLALHEAAPPETGNAVGEKIC